MSAFDYRSVAANPFNEAVQVDCPLCAEHFSSTWQKPEYDDDIFDVRLKAVALSDCYNHLIVVHKLGERSKEMREVFSSLDIRIFNSVEGF